MFYSSNHSVHHQFSRALGGSFSLVSSEIKQKYHHCQYHQIYYNIAIITMVNSLLLLLYTILGYHTFFYPKFWHLVLRGNSYLRVRFSAVCFASFWFSQSSCNQHQIDYTWLAYKNDENPQSLQGVYSIKNVPKIFVELVLV